MRRGPQRLPNAPAHCREGPCPAVPAESQGPARGYLVPSPTQGDILGSPNLCVSRASDGSCCPLCSGQFCLQQEGLQGRGRGSYKLPAPPPLSHLTLGALCLSAYPQSVHPG